MSENTPNKHRADRALRAVESYVSRETGSSYRREEPEVHLTDLLTDLHHLADELGVEWSMLVKDAANHHFAEVEEEEQGSPALYVRGEQ